MHPQFAPSVHSVSFLCRRETATHHLPNEVSTAPPGISRLPFQPRLPTSPLRKLHLSVADTFISAGLLPQRSYPAPSSSTGSSLQGVQTGRRLLISAMSAASTFLLPSAILKARDNQHHRAHSTGACFSQKASRTPDPFEKAAPHPHPEKACWCRVDAETRRPSPRAGSAAQTECHSTRQGCLRRIPETPAQR